MSSIFDFDNNLGEIVDDFQEEDRIPEDILIRLQTLSKADQLTAINKEIGDLVFLAIQDGESKYELFYGPFGEKFLYSRLERYPSKILLSPYVLKIAVYEPDGILIPCLDDLKPLSKTIDDGFAFSSLEEILETLDYLELFDDFPELIEQKLEQRVRQFWKDINERYVPYLQARFHNSHIFGDQQPNLETLQRVQNPNYYPNTRTQLTNMAIRHYNAISEKLKQKFSLPIEIVKISDLDSFYDQLSEAIQFCLIELDENSEQISPNLIFESNDEGRKTLEYLNYVLSFCSHYDGEGIDFSQNSKPFRYRVFKIGEHENYRRLLRMLLDQNNSQINNALLRLPESYDLILKSDLDFNPKLIKYALFLSYLDEIYTRSATKPTSRFILSLEDLKRLIDRFHSIFNGTEILKAFMPLPFIPHRNNWISHPFWSNIVGRRTDFILSELNKLLLVKTYKGITFHLNGSSIPYVITRRWLMVSNWEKYPLSDLDIRLESPNETYLSDHLFDEAVEYYVDYHRLTKLKKVMLSDGKKYKYHAIWNSLKVEFYRGSFGYISNYHVPSVRADYDGDQLLFYPSAVVANITGFCLDLRYFKTENSNPMEIVRKYYSRGYSFFLNDAEMSLFIDYYSRFVSDLVFGTYRFIHQEKLSFEDFLRRRRHPGLPGRHPELFEQYLQEFYRSVMKYYNENRRTIDDQKLFQQYGIFYVPYLKLATANYFKSESRFRKWIHPTKHNLPV